MRISLVLCPRTFCLVDINIIDPHAHNVYWSKELLMHKSVCLSIYLPGVIKSEIGDVFELKLSYLAYIK